MIFFRCLKKSPTEEMKTPLQKFIMKKDDTYSDPMKCQSLSNVWDSLLVEVEQVFSHGEEAFLPFPYKTRGRCGGGWHQVGDHSWLIGAARDCGGGEEVGSKTCRGCSWRTGTS